MASLVVSVVAGGVHAPPASAAPVPAAAVRQLGAVEPDVKRPIPVVPHVPWDGTTGVQPALDPRMRTIVEDNAAIGEEPEIRDAATAALAVGTDAAVMEFLNKGLTEARAKAAARKKETAARNLATVKAMAGTGGANLEAGVKRVLAGTDQDRADFVAFGADIARMRDAKVAQSAKERADTLRVRITALTARPGEVGRAAKAALAAGDAAIETFFATGYLAAAKLDAEQREKDLAAQEERNRAAEALTELAVRAARASTARRELMVAHGNGVRALKDAANAMVSAGNEARRAEQLLATGAAGASYDAIRAEVLRQLGYAEQAAFRTQQAAATATNAANTLAEVDLTYGAEWAALAVGMTDAATAAVGAAQTAQHAITATEATHKAKDAQARAEAHRNKAIEWRKHAEQHAAAAASLAKAAEKQAVAAKNAAERAKRARIAAEAAEKKAWAAAERTRQARLTAEAEQRKAAAFRVTAEKERANAAAARQRAESQAAVARTSRANAEQQAGVAAGARRRAEEQEDAADRALNKASTAEVQARNARNNAEAAERDEETAIAKAQAHEAWAAAATGEQAKQEAGAAARQARSEAGIASGAARSARASAHTASGAAANARGAANEAERAAARARAAADQAQAAAARADAAADKAEAEAAATHAAALDSNRKAAEATAEEAKAAEASDAATRLAEQAADEAVKALWAADRTRDEAEAAISEAVSAAAQADVAIQAALAARSSSEGIIDPANAAISVVAPFTGTDLSADFIALVAEQAKVMGQQQATAAQDRAREAIAAAVKAEEAARVANEQVKPAYLAAARAARSAADAATSAAEAKLAAAQAAADGAAARAAAARANQADAQARADAAAARRAANAAANDAAIAGRSAAAAEQDAAMARNAATAAERDAAAARNAATAAENDAKAADQAATNAEEYAQLAAVAADNALGHAVEAQKAADRAEEQARLKEQQRRAELMNTSLDEPLSPAQEKDLLGMLSPAEQEEYRKLLEMSGKGIIDFLKENAGDLIMGLLGLDNLKGCFVEGNVSACIWALVDVIPWSKAIGLGVDIVKFLPKVKRFLDGLADAKRKLGQFKDKLRHKQPESCPIRPPGSSLRASTAAKKLANALIGVDGRAGATAGAAAQDQPFWTARLQDLVKVTALPVGQWLRTASGSWVQTTAVRVTAGIEAIAASGPSSPAKGAAGTRMLIDELLQKGYSIRGTEISATAANGVNIRFDVVAEKNGQIYVFDAKNGPKAGFTQNQGKKGGYASIESSGGTFYGPNAQTAGLGGQALGPTRVNIAGFGGYPHC